MEKIDSEEFNAKHVFEGLLKTQTLKNLVQTNLEIQAEIKSLDHDVQSLVFENYSKFISSIDVVKKMREEVEKTESDLEKLTESIDRIKRYTGSIDETLKPKRAEIQRLDRINKDLSNLKVLCELPIMLKEDLKQLHALDLLTLSADELAKLRPEVTKLLRKSLDSLNMCKDKLIEFCREPLIAPIFADVNKYLKEIQNYLFLHFYDNNAKMGFELLSDAFTKLANIVMLTDLMNPTKKQTTGQNSIENLIVIFFKYANSHVQRQTASLTTTQSQPPISLVDEVGLDGKRSFDDFKNTLSDALKKNANPTTLAQIKDLLHSVFQSINGIDKQFVKMGLPSEVMSFYNTKKNQLHRRFLYDALSKSLDCNFLIKAQLIVDNKGYVNEPSQLDALIEFLAEEVLFRDVLTVFDQLCLREQKRLVQKEFLDLKTSRFPLIRDEINLKNEIGSQADSFATSIRHFAAIVGESLEQLVVGGHTTLLLNADAVTLGLLDRLLSSQNNKISAKQALKVFKRKEVSLDASQIGEGRSRDSSRALSLQPQEETVEPLVKRPKLKGGLRLLHFIFATRVLSAFQESLSRSHYDQLFHKDLCAVFSFFEREFLRSFNEFTERPNDTKASTDLLNLIKNSVFFANSLMQEGIPKSRLTKQIITSQFAKSSETSKLLARQAGFFEDSSPLTRQKLFFGLTKLFFKSIRVFFVINENRAANYQPLFVLFAQVSQTLFESCEKEDESSFAALFYQAVDDFENAGCSVDPARRNQILTRFKEQSF